MSDEPQSLPKPHRNSSFSYKTIDSRVTGSLRTRSILDNTIQIGMPFIKVTATLDLPDILGEGNWGFTLGIHSTPEDLKYQNIYSSRRSQGSRNEYLIGYTYNQTDGTTEEVYTKTIDSAEPLIGLIDVGGTIYSGDDNSSDFAFIPPPGITNAKILRNKDGRVVIAQIDFTVPTLPQLEMLHRTFLVPGLNMVVEWGQQLAPKINSMAEEPLSQADIESNFFPWHRPSEGNLRDLFRRMGKKQVGLQEILENYTYPSGGKYMWMYGNVANFSVKGNADGSYNCQIKIIGPHEAAWAYNVINTVVPVRGSSNEICASGVYSVAEYLSATNDALNLKTLVQKVYSDAAFLPDWKGHVVKITGGNKKPEGEGDLEVDAGTETEGRTDGNNQRLPDTSTVDAAGFGDDDDAYYISWRFFVNVVLNDKDYGLKAIFKASGMTDEEVDSVAMLRQYRDKDGGNPGTTLFIDDPYETFVGNNKYLRSIDISSLVIVNETAVNSAREYLRPHTPDANTLAALFGLGPGGANDSPAVEMARKGDFHVTGNIEITEGSNPRDKGLLSTGVWLNHKAIIETMVSSDTILGGISNLLQRMNSATSNYWNLMIDESAPTKFDGIEDDSYETDVHDYIVVDASYHENSNYALQNFLNDVYVFNKYIRNDGGTLIGSELIESNIELSLPQTLFAQIATLGLVQQEDLNPDEAKDSVVIGVNETLRQMFAITSLYGNRDNIPDLTKQKDPGIDRTSIADGFCGGTVNRTENSATGTGFRVSTTSRPNVGPTIENASQLSFGSIDLAPTLPTIAQSPTQVTQSINDAVTTLGSALCSEECIETPPTGSSQSSSQSNEATQAAIARLRGTESPILTNVEGVQMANPTQGVGRISSPHGVNRDFRGGARHKGIDIAMPVGTPIYAAHSGRIKTAQFSSSAGNFIEIISDENSQITTRYFHLNSFAVRSGNVARSQLIGYSGNTGTSSGPHLHFEIRKGSPTANAKDLADQDPSALFTVNARNPRSVPTTLRVQYKNIRRCDPCREAQRVADLNQAQFDQARRTREAVDDRSARALRRFSNLLGILKYQEIMPDIMVSNIARDSNGNESNAFGAAPGSLSIKANMKMPGIAGLRVGELFWMDRMPLFYRAFGAFQTMTIEDDISLDGWTTSISARFNYLGAAWKQSIVNLIRSGDV
jgi:murein DD-endopeptidase MepM/ murein hydrolase activator NlpD